VVAVESQGAFVRLVAQSDDGERAERIVEEPSLLAPTVLGLVIAVPDLAPPMKLAADSGPAVAAPGGGNGAAAGSGPLAVPPNGGGMGLWLGIGVGARYGAPSRVVMLDFEARADLRVDRALLFLALRGVPKGAVLARGEERASYRESSIGFGLGRSFDAGTCTVDVAVVPALSAMRMDPNGPSPPLADYVDLRLGLMTRLGVPLSRSWRLTLTADTDVVPDRLSRPIRDQSLPAIPSWTSGIQVGASGAIL
jgi:hypothetical protein